MVRVCFIGSRLACIGGEGGGGGVTLCMYVLVNQLYILCVLSTVDCCNNKLLS